MGTGASRAPASTRKPESSFARCSRIRRTTTTRPIGLAAALRGRGRQGPPAQVHRGAEDYSKAVLGARSAQRRSRVQFGGPACRFLEEAGRGEAALSDDFFRTPPPITRRAPRPIGRSRRWAPNERRDSEASWGLVSSAESLRREIAVAVVDEGPDTIVFLDHRPVFPGHCLVVPKQHYETLLDVPPDDARAALRQRAAHRARGRDWARRRRHLRGDQQPRQPERAPSCTCTWFRAARKTASRASSGRGRSTKARTRRARYATLFATAP